MSRHLLTLAPADRASLYDEITDKIIAELEAGRVPWVQPWGTAAAKAPLAMPKNASTSRYYSGINVLILWGAVIEHGFPTRLADLSPGARARRPCPQGRARHDRRLCRPLHSRRREETGASDRRGSASDPVPQALHRLQPGAMRRSAGGSRGRHTATGAGLIEPTVEALIKATGVDFRIGGSRAFYMPAHDYVQVPPPQAYFEPINWHRTALHELGHCERRPARLNRDLSGSFGSKKYAFEELVAEMNAAFCCASLGIVPTVRHADYIGSWLEVLREDNRAIVRAASQASKAADFLLAFLPGDDARLHRKRAGGRVMRLRCSREQAITQSRIVSMRISGSAGPRRPRGRGLRRSS